MIGDHEDLLEAVKHINRRFPNAKLIILGQSAGSGLVCNFAGSNGEKLNDHNVIGGILISPCYDMKGLAKIHSFYDQFMSSKTKTFWSQQHPDVKADKSIADARTVYEVIEAHHKWTGCKDFEEYMRRFNPQQKHIVENIRVPLLCVNAKDDPICIYENVTNFIEASSDLDIPLSIATTERGSHVAWFGFWGESVVTKWSMDFALALCRDAYEDKENKNNGVSSYFPCQ